MFPPCPTLQCEARTEARPCPQPGRLRGTTSLFTRKTPGAPPPHVRAIDSNCLHSAHPLPPAAVPFPGAEVGPMEPACTLASLPCLMASPSGTLGPELLP